MAAQTLGQPPTEQLIVENDEPVVEQEPENKLRTLISTILILLLAPAIAIVLTMFVFQSYQVDGPSMEQTLHNNDRLIVWKLPRTWSRLTGHQYVPGRGDIIILNEAGLSAFGSGSDTKQLVKRVIGLPGDHIVIKDNTITIYNKAHPTGFNPDTTLAYGKETKLSPTLNDLEVTLGSDELYVCGDNRINSLDSRTFGPIKTSQVVGKLAARILPLGSMKVF